MLKQFYTVLLAAVMALVGFTEGGAFAFPTQTPPAALQSDASPLIIDVRHGGGGYHGGYHGYRPGYRPGYNYYRPRYNNHYYGRRCGYYSSYCRYRYNGYYYPNQWWLGGIAAGVAVGAAVNSNNYGYSKSKHKNWCANKYRSYNPKTNTYVTKNGVKKKCNSPYN